MTLNLTELTKAVAAVAAIAAENSILKNNMEQAQQDVDALTASIIAATTSPAGAVGLAAVAAALPLPPPLPMPPVEAEDVLANLK